MNREPLYLESGPEPTLGIRNNSEVRTDREIAIMALALFLMGAVSLYLLLVGGKYGVCVGNEYLDATNFATSNAKNYFLITAAVSDIIGLMHIAELTIRKNCREMARKGRVVGYRRSGKYAKDTKNMDLVVEGMLDGKKELFRVTTPYGEKSKMYYDYDDTVYYYRLGKRYFAKDVI